LLLPLCPCLPSPCCRDLDNIGTTYLANKLSNHLINEITRKLPDIQSYVDKT
jgi:dynamin 1-like protein